MFYHNIFSLWCNISLLGVFVILSYLLMLQLRWSRAVEPVSRCLTVHLPSRSALNRLAIISSFFCSAVRTTTIKKYWHSGHSQRGQPPLTVGLFVCVISLLLGSFGCENGICSQFCCPHFDCTLRWHCGPDNPGLHLPLRWVLSNNIATSWF